jgi:hypothetical protein
MQPEWLYYFLIGTNQYGSPVMVVFCVNTREDTVYVLPFSKIHPLSTPLKKVALMPTELGRIITNKMSVMTKTRARGAWDELCDDTQYNMKPTTFEEQYPEADLNEDLLPMLSLDYKYSVLPVRSVTQNRTDFKRQYTVSVSNNTNYALEA